MMPSNSKAQRHLMAAAEHGATFPMAKQLRATMSHRQLHDFAATPEKGLPAHVGHPSRNLGKYLRAPLSGEIVTEHHRGAKQRHG